MKQSLLLIFLMVVLVVNMTGITQAENISVAHRFGAGIQMNVLNLGVGPCVEYWITENFGLLAAVGAMFDFTSITIRGNYLLNQTLDIAGYPARPYIGAGYALVKGPDYGPIEQEGSGLEIYGGLLHSASYITKNLYFRGEFILSTFELETTGKTSYGETVNIDQDWGFFSFGAGISYYF